MLSPTPSDTIEGKTRALQPAHPRLELQHSCRSVLPAQELGPAPIALTPVDRPALELKPELPRWQASDGAHQLPEAQAGADQ